MQAIKLAKNNVAGFNDNRIGTVDAIRERKE